MNPTQSNEVTYDLTPLKQGALYDITKAKKAFLLALVGSAIAAPFIIVGIFILMVFTLLKTSTFELVFLLFSIFPIFMVGGFGMVVALFVRIPQLYKHSVEAFGALNQLNPVGMETIRNRLPPSLLDSAAYTQAGNGYYLKLGGQQALVYDYTYIIDGGKSSRRYDFAVASLELTKHYPHLYLDGAANGRNSAYTQDQRVNLEGDFNKYFSLYMPEGSAAGSLTVLSPDVMQTLIDQAQPFDIELNNNTLSIITTGRAFTRENLQKLLIASKALSKEFDELDGNWQPVMNANGKPYILRRSNWKLKVFIEAALLMALVQFFIFTQLDFAK